MQLTRSLAWVLLAGAVLWILKLVQIVVSGGDNTDEGLVGLAFVLGVLALLVGSSSVGLWLARRRPLPVRIAAGVIAIAAFWFSFQLVDLALQEVVGDAGPAYVHDEVGILAAALAWMGLAVWVLRASRDRGPAAA